MADLYDLDAAVFMAINAAHCAVADRIFSLASHRGLGLAAGLVLAAALVWRHRTRAWPTLLAAAVVVALVDTIGAKILKPWIGRIRPCFALPPGTFRQIAEAANVGSMPSLHAANAFAVATILTLSDRRLGWLLLPLAALVAVSRVYVGVHWPSDVMGGALWGTIVALGVHALVHRRAWRRPARGDERT